MSRPIVFPSGTGTFGLVMIEALACGTPVAAFPVASPRGILTDGVGAMSEDLAAAVSVALTRARSTCAQIRRGFQLGSGDAPVHRRARRAGAAGQTG